MCVEYDLQFRSDSPINEQETFYEKTKEDLYEEYCQLNDVPEPVREYIFYLEDIIKSLTKKNKNNE